MAIKNSQITKPAQYYISLVQNALINHGAIGMQMMFDSEKRISAVSFALPTPEGKGNLSFQLPCEWRKFQQVIKADGNYRWDQDEYCYRVAWANLKDWIEAQMALYETEMVSMPQIFLPFVTGTDGRTLFEQIAEDPKQFLLE